MANRAFRTANDLAGMGVIPIPVIEDVMARMHGHFPIVVLAEVRHAFERRLLGESELEAIGKRWRAAHGFGRKCSSGNAPGSGRGYRYGESHKDAAARAKNRKAQKAARVRDRLAHATKRASAAIRTMFRGNTRGS